MIYHHCLVHQFSIQPVIYSTLSGWNVRYTSDIYTYRWSLDVQESDSGSSSMGLPGDKLGWDGVGRVDSKQFQRSDSIEMHLLFYSKLNMY